MPTRRSQERKERSKGREVSAERVINSLPTRKPGTRTFRTFVIYGRAGTGKTTLAGTFPEPILLIDLKDHGDESVVGVKGMDVLDVEDIDGFEDAFWYLKKHPKKYKTVVIDTVTQLQQMTVEMVLDGKKLNGKIAGDWGTMSKQQWGDVAAIMKRYINDFRDLEGMNVVFLAQDRVFNLADDESEIDNDLEPEVGPRLSPSVASHLNAAVSIIGNTLKRERTKTTKGQNGKDKVIKTGKVEYCLRIGPSPLYITKVRKSRDIKLPDFIENPTYDDIIEVVKGTY